MDKEKENKEEKKENENNINTDKIKEIEGKLNECQKKCEEYLNGWKRERANFLNYKKEEIERIQGLIEYATEELILKMLPVLDNFDIAEKNIPDELKENENVKGILQIKYQLLDFLKNQGIEEIKTVGEKFDPYLHEAVEEVELNDKDHDIIIEEIQKGYKIKGKLLRSAKVKINK